MSRSYKKFAYCSDGENGRATSGKKFANKKVRKAKFNELPKKGKGYKKIYPQYDIRDDTCHWTWKEALKDYNTKSWRKKYYPTEKEFYIFWYKTMKAK